MMKRNTKIVATLGPASNSATSILELAQAGVDVFRLNMSHGQHDAVAELHSHIRAAERKIDRPLAVLGDLQGPKIRCGVFSDGSTPLEKGDLFSFDLNASPGNHTRVQLPHPEILSVLKSGMAVLVNDGKIRMRVVETTNERVMCEVIVPGEISNRKGVNLPDVILPVSALSSKDKDDLEFLCELGIDWLALSFVQRAEDVMEAKSLVKGRAAVLSKIEKPAAVENFGEILDASDGVMIARGDLGVEMPNQQVPRVQKALLSQTRTAGKPVIVATQMLESMIEAPVPTRAEVSDVATAIYDGADAVMLSAETAMGANPRAAVEVMNAVARETENDPKYAELMSLSESGNEKIPTSHAIAAAAREISDRARISAICCFTQSGATAQLVAREKPLHPIIAMTPNPATARRMSLVWGLRSVVVAEASRFKEVAALASQESRHLGFAQPGDEVVVTAGLPVEQEGSTNILRVSRVE